MTRREADERQLRVELARASAMLAIGICHDSLPNVKSMNDAHALDSSSLVAIDRRMGGGQGKA